MGKFGEHLKSEREARGISLEDISSKTRIGVRLLAAIESERFDLLPGGVFNLSFVRQYALHVGLNEDEIAEQFKRVAQPVELEVTESVARSSEAEAAQETGAALAEDVTEYTRRHQFAFPAILIAATILTIGAILFSGRDQTEEDVADRPGVEAPAADEPDRGPGEASVVRPASSQAGQSSPSSSPEPPRSVSLDPPRETSMPVRVNLSITDTVWIEAAADGKRVFVDTLRAGDSKSIEAADSVHLLVGNAAAVTVALNGEKLPPLGPPGTVRRVRLTPSGMVFVQPPPNPPAESGPSAPNSVETQTREPSENTDSSVAQVTPSGLP